MWMNRSNGRVGQLRGDLIYSLVAFSGQIKAC